LDEGFVWRPIIAKDHGNAGHAIAANQPNFKLAVAVGGDNRSESGLQKVDPLDGFIRLFENVPKGKVYTLKRWLKKRQIAFGQSGQNIIFKWWRGGGHRLFPPSRGKSTRNLS
jgi:hypothetical protein